MGGTAVRGVAPGSPPRRALAVLLVLASACSGPPPALQVGPAGFSAEQLAPLSPDALDVLPRLTAFGLAVAEGTIDDVIAPHVQRDLRSLRIQRLALELAADAEGMRDTELRRIYEDQPMYELVVRHLVVLSERWRPDAHRDSARARAEEALARVRAGAPFEDVVSDYSDEPGAAERGGLLQPGREGSWVPEFWEAASSLAEGEVSDVVATEFGFHVLRLEERRPIPFEEVRDQVLEQVMSLPRALGEAGSWASRRVREAAVDTQRVDAWRATRTPDAILVRWPDSLNVPPLTGRELAEYVHTLPPAGRPDQPLDRSQALGLATSAARTHVMHVEAERRGIEPSESQRAAIRERWAQRVDGWVETLGLERGLSVGGVEERALRLAGSERQGVAIARSELEELDPLLFEMYPVRRPAGDAPGDSLTR